MSRHRDSPCWVWPGSKGWGYGQKQDPVSKRLRPAHILVYEAMFGPVPEGAQLDHLCHTDDLSCPGGVTCPHRACCNPYHLEPVTPQANLLRGPTTQAAKNAAKTHCPAGHPYDEANTWVDQKRGIRTCRTCHRERNKLSERKRRAKRKAAQS